MSSETEYAPSPTAWVRETVEKIEAAGTTEVAAVQGNQVVLLTMRGNKSGKLRKVPLLRVEQDGKYAAVASNGGEPKHPVWYYNVKADPKLTLQDGAVTDDYVARELDGDEYDLWWKRAVAVYPGYTEYQANTSRKIPVFLLEPVE